MKERIFICCLLVLLCNCVIAQLVLDNGGSITIDNNAAIQVAGSIHLNNNITGAGKLVLTGNAATLNANGYSISNVEINSPSAIGLTGNVSIANTLNFTSGRLILNNANLQLSSSVSVIGAGVGKYIETNGSGDLRKEVTTATIITLPLGANGDYMPIEIETVGGSYSTEAYVATRLVPNAHPEKPFKTEDYLKSYWKINTAGITAATINATATYQDVTGITGSESLMYPLKWNGTEWALTNNSINTSNNTISYNMVNNGDELYAANKFVLMQAKVFLQGAYNSVTGKMNDNLRAGTNIIPTADPYRQMPYAATFTHSNNSNTEVANAAVFATQSNDDNNIVDWVFIELRNTSYQLVQTRSALIQKDGDIVDIDGVSPLFFKNVDAANYVITVRHRNHLGLAAEATNYAKALNFSRPTLANSFDFTTATDNQLFGNSAAYKTINNINVLWCGNANANSNLRYSGPSNDNAAILTTILGGSSTLLSSNIYSAGDLNMNRNVRYSGPSNDNSFLISTVLGGVTTQVISQQIPN